MTLLVEKYNNTNINLYILFSYTLYIYICNDEMDYYC